MILDSKLATQLRAKAQSNGMSLSAFRTEAARAALKAEAREEAIPFELAAKGKEGAYPGINSFNYKVNYCLIEFP